MVRFAWAAALLALLPRLADAAEFSAVRIELEGDASASQRYAAEEIARYVAKAVGRSPQSGEAADRPLVVRIESDASVAGSDGFAIDEKGGVLRIRGSRERGCLYGAYEFLERFIGVKWYSPDFEVVPSRRSFEVPDGFSLVETPDFEMRMMEWYDLDRDGGFSSKLRINSGCEAFADEKFGGDAYRFGKGLGICHTFASLLGDEQFDDHPEYFSMINGKRTKDHSQLCLTNPDVLAIVTSNVLRRIRQDPDAVMYGVSQNDWYGYCTCPKCAAVDEEEESTAGTMLRFVNAIAEAVEKEFP